MTQPAERIPGQNRMDTSRSSETVSSRRVAVITGASRDIGAALARKFSQEGIITIGNHRDPQKEKRVSDVRSEIESIGGELQVGDITTSEGRQGLVDAIDARGGKLDILVLNAANNARELNVVANNALVDLFLPRMNEGGTIVFMQSVPSHFNDSVKGSFIPEYEAVADSKQEAELSLRRRQEEFDDAGVKLLIVCPPEVSDTANIRLFNMRDKQASEKSAALSRALGLPEKKTSAEVADSVFDLIQRKDELPSGYLELFGPEDAQTTLETWYGTPDTVGIQTLQRNEFKGIPLGLGRSVVSREQVDFPKRLHMVDGFERDKNGDIVAGKLIVTPEKSRGHLNTENGFPLIFPGHKQIRAAVETIQAIERDAGNSHFSRLKRFDLAQFTSVALADGTHTLTVVPEVVMRGENDEATYNIKVFDENGKQTAAITNLTVSYSHDKNPDVLPEDFIIEAAAQTAGATLLPSSKVDKGSLPLFGQVGPVDFFGGMLKPGVGVEYYAGGSGNEKGIEGSVEVVSDGEKIASIGGIKAVVVPTRVGFRMVGFKPAVSSN